MHIRFVVVGIMGLRLGCSICRGELYKEAGSYCNDCDDDVVHVDKKDLCGEKTGLKISVIVI